MRPAILLEGPSGKQGALRQQDYMVQEEEEKKTGSEKDRETSTQGNCQLNVAS